MKELLVAFVEYLFYLDPNEEITFKFLLIIILKIIVFILIVSFILWLLLK